MAVSVPFQRIAVITGANRGIGLGLGQSVRMMTYRRGTDTIAFTVRHLALEYRSSVLNIGRLLIILAVRDLVRGHAAIAGLEAEERVVGARVLDVHGGLTSLRCMQLNIDSEDSIARFAHDLHEHYGLIDIVVSNAGIERLDDFGPALVHATLRTNFYGTMSLCMALLPLLKPSQSSRLVTIASIDGMVDRSYARYSKEIQDRFRTAAKSGLTAPTAELAMREVTLLMEQYQKLSALGRVDVEKAGFSSNAYAVSKAGVIAAMRSLGLWAQRPDRVGFCPTVVSCCPGWVRTELTRGKGDKEIDEGIITPLFLILKEYHGSPGDFWEDKKRVDWSGEMSAKP